MRRVCSVSGTPSAPTTTSSPMSLRKAPVTRPSRRRSTMFSPWGMNTVEYAAARCTSGVT